MIKNKKKSIDKDMLLKELLEDNERLSGVEKSLRILSDRCGQMFVTFRIIKYPIVFDRPRWRLLIVKGTKDKNIKLYDGNNMSLDDLLKSAIKFMDDYILKHKEYNIWRGGCEPV